MKKSDYDIIFIGGGYRAVSFIASNPDLLSFKIAIIEERSSLGPGAYADLIGCTNSAGSSFFKHIDRNGPFGWIFQGEHSRVSCSPSPVQLSDLSATLSALGATITRQVGITNCLTGSRVASIEVAGAASEFSDVYLDTGVCLQGKFIVLATGRHEIPNRELVRWKSKTLVSSCVLSRSYQPCLRRRLCTLGDTAVVVAGASHSAFAAALHVLSLAASMRHSGGGFRAQEIIFIHRGDFRVFHTSLSAWEALEVREGLENVDVSRHVCPQTGNVFRDTGLRHRARELCLSMLKGTQAAVRHHRVSRLANARQDFENAGLIIQALGYKGRYPAIRAKNGEVRRLGHSYHPTYDARGFLLDPSEVRLGMIAALRPDPTPKCLQDSGVYGRDLYERLGDELRQSILPTSPANTDPFACGRKLSQPS